MSFELKAGEAPAEGLRRIAIEQIDDALEQMSGRAGVSRDEAVHEARKSFKKIRGVLRLLRKALGSKLYRAENTCFRDAGRPLTEVRDAKILVETLDKLMKHFRPHVSPEKFAGVRESLVAHQGAVRTRVLDQEDAFVKVSAAVGAARQRAGEWHLGGGWSALENGVKRIYRSGRRAHDAVRADPTVESLHEWRKQVKYLWYQLQILEPVCPEVMKGLEKLGEELSDLLGDDHDLAVLRQMLADQAEEWGEAAAVETLVALIDRRRAELQQQAVPQGDRLYGDKPKVFVQRLGDYRKAWRSESKGQEAVP